MFPDFSVQTRAETLRKSSAFSWCDAGMGFRGVCSTANFSESPNAAVECSLSDVLEDHAPQRFFLSPRAAAGILRRAEKRGRELPTHLRQALEALSSEADDKDRIPLSQRQSLRDSQLAGMTRTDTQSILCAQRSEAEGTQRRVMENPAGQTECRLYSNLDMGVMAAESLNLSANRSKPKAEQPEKMTPVHYSVRRLTPTECEVLQGFPKGWTVPATERSATRSRSKLRNGLRKG
jgi:site-specific DNA-cytosine methylase